MWKNETEIFKIKPRGGSANGIPSQALTWSLMKTPRMAPDLV